MRDNPPPYLRHTAWSGILQRFFALALVELGVRTGQTDRQADKQTGKTRIAA